MKDSMHHFFPVFALQIPMFMIYRFNPRANRYTLNFKIYISNYNYSYL